VLITDYFNDRPSDDKDSDEETDHKNEGWLYWNNNAYNDIVFKHLGEVLMAVTSSSDPDDYYEGVYTL